MGDRLNHPPDESAYFLVLLIHVKRAIEIDIPSLTIVEWFVGKIHYGFEGSCCISRGGQGIGSRFGGSLREIVNRGLKLWEARWALVSRMNKSLQKGFPSFGSRNTSVHLCLRDCCAQIYRLEDGFPI